MGPLDDLTKSISDYFIEIHKVANQSAGPNDDRAIIMAIEALTGAVLAVATAIATSSAAPPATDGTP